MSVLISDRTDVHKRVDPSLPLPLPPLPQDSKTEEDWFAQEARTAENPRPAAAMMPTAAAPVTPLPDPAQLEEAAAARRQDRILSGLLRMADSYRDTGALHQAIEMYFMLIREHDGTPQADSAIDRLLDVARGQELAGELRQARSIYEQLL